MKIDKKEIDFGTITEGDVVSTTVSLKNNGNSKLVIDDVKSSCGCTAALLSSKQLSPGETGELKIEFDSANRSGKLTRTVTLHTNEQNNPNHTIILYANVLKEDS